MQQILDFSDPEKKTGRQIQYGKYHPLASRSQILAPVFRKRQGGFFKDPQGKNHAAGRDPKTL